MALAVDSEMPSNTGFQSVSNPASPQTFSFTNTAGGLLILACGVGAVSGGVINFGAVSYNSVAMTKIASLTPLASGQGGEAGLYQLLSPATGANTVSMAFSGSGIGAQTIAWAAAISFSGNDTSNPVPQSTTNGDQSGTTSAASATLSGCVAGNITVAVAGAGTNFSSSTQTLSASFPTNTNSALNNGRLTRAASSGSVTHGFTVAANDDWVVVMAEIAAAGLAPSKIGTRPQSLPFMSNTRI